MSKDNSVIMTIGQKNMTYRIPPFKVTWGHWNQHRSIGKGNLWLPISDP